jgi:hypothetical protein
LKTNHLAALKRIETFYFAVSVEIAFLLERVSNADESAVFDLFDEAFDVTAELE